MSAGSRAKGIALLAGIAAVAGTLAAARPLSAAALALALFAWLALETRSRLKFRFLAPGAGGPAEAGFGLAAEAMDLRCDGSALFVLGKGLLRVADARGPRPVWAALNPAPLAALALADGSLILAYEERLALAGPDGRERSSLPFEAPLLRQSYRLLLAPDASLAALVTPWSAHSFSPNLQGPAALIRYEDAGHYFKYAALGPAGSGLLLGGAFLLDEEQGGSLEARWGWWRQAGGAAPDWSRAWSRASESYENTQLRGVQVSADGGLLCTERWRAGYEFEVQDPSGATLWERRGGERPVLSASGGALAWEDGSGDLVVSAARDGAELWRWRPSRQLRLKRVLEDGSCIVLEGRCLRGFRAGGAQAWERWLAQDPEHVALGPQGLLALAAGSRGACLDLSAGGRP